MRTGSLIAVVMTASLGVLAAPAPTAPTSMDVDVDLSAALDAVVLAERQVGGDGKFCKKTDPAPSANETAARHEKFANAFLVKKDIDETFSYIDPGYVNNGRATGAQAAYDFLKRIWSTQNITVIKILFRGDMGWLNYRSGMGTIVDRYRWEGGCIVQHWDSGEKMPED